MGRVVFDIHIHGVKNLKSTAKSMTLESGNYRVTSFKQKHDSGGDCYVPVSQSCYSVIVSIHCFV